MSNIMSEVGQFFARRAKILLPSIFLALIIPSLMLTTELIKPNVSVIINGEYIGMVATQQQFEEQIYAVEQFASEVLEQPYKLNIEKEYVFSYGGDYETLSDDESNIILSKYVSGISEVASIYVDGEPIGAVQTVEEANAILDEILVDAVGKDHNDGASFVQDVQVVEELASVGELMSANAIKSYFTSTAVGPSIHKVAKNQTLSEIASAYGMRTADIVELNPEIEPERMQIGQDILIEKAQPAVSVSITKTETYTESIAYSTETQYDDSMTTTQKTTLVSGKEGSKEIVAEVTYVDDVAVETIIISETVTSEPVTAVVKVGTQKPQATGDFILPVTGATLSSPYGYRSSGFHTGIDLATSYGTSIKASDGGTVTYSGWNGGYGYCVIISHGNGFETLYAHCSALMVSVGDKVTQGDKIAEVGSTGNSTGNHLHFEIRVNGNHQNPYNYL
ncbi:MAG: peptidoglycan DD-metalloendopeptidase family protein [Clostridia bacterium]